MKMLSDGTIWLKTGETIPVFCIGCQWLYQPAAESECSDCPNCGNFHVHQNTPQLSIVVSDVPPRRRRKRGDG